MINFKLMFYVKIFILWALVTGFFLVSKSHAVLNPSGPEEQSTVMPSFTDNGNMWRQIGGNISTTNVVLISSAPERSVQVSTPGAIAFPGEQNVSTNNVNAGNLGIRDYRLRTIVNISTCARLALYPTSNYNQFSTTYAVLLASVTTTRGLGDSYTVYHQGEIWGIWGPSGDTSGCGPNGFGFVGEEDYYDSKRRR